MSERNPPSVTCDARTRSGTPCRRAPTPGSHRCRLHGGLTPKGVESPHFKHGRHSGALKKLGGDFVDAMNDPELMDMRRAIAYRDLLVIKAAQRAEDNDSPEMRKQALDLHGEAVAALRSGDADSAWASLSQLGALLRRGVTEDRSLQTLSSQIQRLVSEQAAAWNVALSARSTFSSEDFRVMLLALVAALKDQGIPAEAIMEAMSVVDRDFFGGRFGFSQAARDADATTIEPDPEPDPEPEDETDA